MRRRSITNVLLFGIAGLMAGAAQAQPAPNDKALRIVVPFPAGGAADLIGRVLGQKLTALLGQPVIVDNRSGAAGALGSAEVAKAAPDGNTLLLGTISTHGTGPALKNTAYDPVKDFTAISLLATNPLVFIVNPSVPANTLQEFVTYVKAHPGVSFGSNGIGSYNHLAVELFKSQAHIDLLHVPYRGAAPVMNDLIAGQIQFAAADLAGATPYIKSGKVKALAIATTQRVPGFELPTVMESGYPTFEVTAWYALFGPAGMAPATVARIHAAVVKALESPDIQERFSTIGAMATAESPTQLHDRVQRENVRWANVVKSAKIVAE